MRALALIICLLFPGFVHAGDFQVFQVPWEKTRPRDPAVAGDGSVWFVGQGGDYVGRFDPATEKFNRYRLPPGAGPHNLIVGDDGRLWIAGNAAGWIGRMDPGSGELEQISTTREGIKDPHTLVQADDGRIWFTAQQSNRIGLLDPTDGSLRSWEIATPRARPYGIVLDDAGRPWIALLGTNRLATVRDGKLEEAVIPRENARPRRLDFVNGRIWYVDYADGYVGSYEPAEQEFKEWRTPGGKDSAPYGAVAAGNIFWFVETGPQPNRMIGLNTATGNFIYEQPIPGSGGAVRNMFHDRETDAIWFGTDTNQLVRFMPPR